MLQSFVAVAETKSFTLAAKKLDVSQSTISSQIQRLEESLGRHLFARNTHFVVPTPDGDALLGFARDVLEATARLDQFLSGSELRGRVRLGACEDFALFGLAAVLADFARRHNSVDVELTIGLSQVLYSRFDAGELDVIFTKRRPGDGRGVVAWREQLVWIGRPGFEVDDMAPLPLVMLPPPSLTRMQTLGALEKAGRSWRIACTSASLIGLRAAAMAGLGVAAHSTRLISPGLVALPFSGALPEIGEIEYVAIGPSGHQIASALIAAIVSDTERLQALPKSEELLSFNNLG